MTSSPAVQQRDDVPDGRDTALGPLEPVGPALHALLHELVDEGLAAVEHGRAERCGSLLSQHVRGVAACRQSRSPDDDAVPREGLVNVLAGRLSGGVRVESNDDAFGADEREQRIDVSVLARPADSQPPMRFRRTTVSFLPWVSDGPWLLRLDASDASRDPRPRREHSSAYSRYVGNGHGRKSLTLLLVQIGGVMSEAGRDPTAVIERLRDATNAHDLEAIVACFAPDYRNETPSHPARGFVGSEQVRRVWTQALAAITDVSTEIVAAVADGATVWSEWEHRGTRRDGSAHLMRGVIVFGVSDGVIATARFFLEPVDETGDGVDAAVRRQVRVERA